MISQIHGAPISVFESGATLHYLVQTIGQFVGETAREKVAVTVWLMWQMGGVGPLAGRTSRPEIRAAVCRQAAMF